ncbi:hypothetical protein BKP37_03520 [Anaerobacillus alkalilacustris]|uniref:Inhibitor of sigma-G Gin n=2 Tax=Anaerobacillus alkalilacustris TaxID=393763 RepID=A0A1S2M201_9BACI|nr:hypothetical protein BKP37_03520 [Anaerobacillus alkalilacustris]
MEVNTIMKEKQCVEKCSVCEQNNENGIHICDIYICENCEREIVNSDVSDEFYRYYLQKLRKLKHSLLNIS